MYLRDQNEQTPEVDAMGRHSTMVAEPPQPHGEMASDDEALLRKVAESLNILSDLSHADLLLFTRADDRVLVAAQARPTPVPPLYPTLLVGQTFSRETAPAIHRALFDGKMARGVKGQVVRGASTIQDIHPVRNAQGKLIGVLSSEMNVLEFERRRKKNSILLRTLEKLRDKALAGRLADAGPLSRLGEHYASLVIANDSRILYISSLAEQMYRKLGYTGRMVGRRLSELDTNEHICFKAMERDRCLEQRIVEHNLVWIKLAVPVFPPTRRGTFTRLLTGTEEWGSAIVMIQDVTEEHKKEQALRVKSALIREIHHRVKNNLQTIAALLRMQARRTGSPEVLDMLKQSINRILSIALVHEFLSKEDGESGEASLINIREVTQQMLSEVTQGILDPEKRIRITLDGGDFHLPAQQATSSALVINELLQNAVEHGFESKNEGTIQVLLREEGDQMVIEVIDDGQGLPPDFDTEKDGSLGLQIIRTLVREDLKGQFIMSDRGGVHSRVSFPRLPLQAKRA